MAVTRYQASILRLLASERRRRNESYVAGGVALNALLRAPRQSRDIDLFHDTTEALQATWVADRDALARAGYDVHVNRESVAFVEAAVSREGERTAMQWVRDSAYRFFPLVEDDLMGLALHPFDLATNKVLAMVGRVEVRDWVDVLNCHDRLQPLGYLVWAACGKDPGYNPQSLLALAARHRYSQAEVSALDFEGVAPDAGALGRAWRQALAAAAEVCDRLPPDRVGLCVLAGREGLFRGDAAQLEQALAEGGLVYHDGRIGGSWPTAIPI